MSASELCGWARRPFFEKTFLLTKQLSAPHLLAHCSACCLTNVRSCDDVSVLILSAAHVPSPATLHLWLLRLSDTFLCATNPLSVSHVRAFASMSTDSIAAPTASSRSRKRTRDEISGFVSECRHYIDHYSVESTLSDRLDSIHNLQRIVAAELELLTAEQQEAQSVKAQMRAAMTGDNTKAEELRRQQVAEVAAKFGLQAWLDRMGSVSPAVAERMERLLGAESEVFRVVSAWCTTHSDDIESSSDIAIQLVVTLPDSLLASSSHSPSTSAVSGGQSSFTLDERSAGGRSERLYSHIPAAHSTLDHHAVRPSSTAAWGGVGAANGSLSRGARAAEGGEATTRSTLAHFMARDEYGSGQQRRQESQLPRRVCRCAVLRPRDALLHRRTARLPARSRARPSRFF